MRRPIIRVAKPPTRPLLIWDGECGFCCFWVQRWRRITGNAVDYMQAQNGVVGARYPELSPEELSRSVWLIEPDGGAYAGAEAVFRSLAPKRRWPIWVYDNIPGASLAAEACYRLIANHRAALSRINRILFSRRHPCEP